MPFPTREVAQTRVPGESMDNRGPKGSTNQALIQVVSTEIHDFCWKDLVFHNHSSGYTGPQKPKKMTALKIKYEKFGPKILIPH